MLEACFYWLRFIGDPDKSQKEYMTFRPGPCLVVKGGDSFSRGREFWILDGHFRHYFDRNDQK